MSKHSDGNTILSLENSHTCARTAVCDWDEKWAGTSGIWEKHGADPWWLVLSQVWVCVCLCACVCVRRNIMHHCTIQTVANAIRITSGQGSLENTTQATHPMHKHDTHTHPCDTHSLSRQLCQAMLHPVTWDKPVLTPNAEWSKQHITLLLRLSIHSTRERNVFINQPLTGQPTLNKMAGFLTAL